MIDISPAAERERLASENDSRASVAVVVPAYNEEHLIVETLTGIPAFVDRIIVVDDASTDSTVERARACAANDPRIEVLVHRQNGGVGAAIVTGYKSAREQRIAITAVMAADNQMDPAELESFVAPIARGEVDYTKANRLVTGRAWELIPRHRFVGNAVLSLLTKVASGYWHIADSQAGYSAIGLDLLDVIDLDRLYPRYGFPNDLLVHLNVWDARVQDVPSRPIYGIGERSGIRIRKVVPRISWLLVKGFFWRMREKYVVRDFHPLVFFYLLGIGMTLLGLGLGSLETFSRVLGHGIPTATIVLDALLLIGGTQFTLFAMWFDMESNKHLRHDPRGYLTQVAVAGRRDPFAVTDASRELSTVSVHLASLDHLRSRIHAAGGVVAVAPKGVAVDSRPG